MTSVAQSNGSSSAESRRTTRRFKNVLPTPIARAKYIGIAISSFVVVLVVWSIITGLGLVKEMFLPSPLAVLDVLVKTTENGQLWGDMSVSIYRVMVGYLLASVVALPLGILAGSDPRFEAAIEPFVDFIRYMPVVAFVPLTILWVGTDDTQKFLIIWLGTFFQEVLMVADAVRQVPRSYQNLGATLGMSRFQILVRIVLPSAMPRIWDTLRICLGWAWTWLVVAELVAATSGMGYRITQAQRFLATDTIIAYVIVLGVLGLVFDQIMRGVGRRMFRYLKGRS
ncbi:ABC transporter permease [Pseudoclavibacter sp. CFCC 11306]|uniref:ABC transporter permease n=1 Tax=Pseudoclavibacter sp. CFCC 11306 TaxID=1564493 RepID=UPI0013011020|nr:ABC transporter permease [Pseudoclavibacter sp. CFCC 11306]KAB1659237.1 ABC transporter permease [Pseudoclavibacter sp. CFCC 11306]